MRLVLVGLVLVFSVGCYTQDYRKEGRAACRALTQELRQIHTREELLRAEPSLQKKFEKLVDLLIAAKQYQTKHPEEDWSEPAAEPQESSALKEELIRIYQLEGGREIIERAQREALFRWDKFGKEEKRKKLSSFRGT